MSVQPDDFVPFFKKYKKYWRQFGEDLPYLIVDYNDIEGWDKDKAEKIIEKPTIYLNALNESTKIILEKYFSSKLEKIKIGIKNCPNKIKLRKLGSEHAFHFVTVRGIVAQIATPQSRPIQGAWKCLKCGDINTVDYNPAIDKRDSPLKCSRPPKGKKKCGGRNFKFIQEESLWVDSQEIIIQEPPENVPAGQIARPVTVLLLGKNLVNSVKAGDRIILTGIVRLEEPSGKQMSHGIFLDANYIETINKEAIEINITSQEAKEIRTIAEDPNIYNQILSSIAPIYGHEVIKEALMYQMFGGVAEKRGTVRIRGDIHTLLIGDPSTSKSQLLVAVKNIMPRAMYTSGQGVTGAGLTAAVVYEGKRWSLRAGALPLSDGSIVCIDEIDKIDKNDRSTIHTAMEQQLIPIHKATIHTELNSRCGVLAAANPRMGAYEETLSVRENLNLPQPLLDRFDFIFIMKDIPNEEKDEEIALYMLGEKEDAFIPSIKPDLLKKYISLARRIEPKLKKEAMRRIAKYYASIRNKGDKDKILITHRQNEAMKRIAQASARIRLSNIATVEDAERAINIIKKMLEKFEISSGEVRDINEIFGGKVPKTLRDKEMAIRKIIREIQPCTVNDIIKAVGEKIPEEDVRKIFAQLRGYGFIIELEAGKFSLTT